VDTPQAEDARRAAARAGTAVHVAGGVALATLVAIGASVWAFNVALTQSRTRARVTVEIARLAHQIASLAVDREAGVRGYLLTGDTLSLAPDRAARVALAADLDSLGALTGDDPPRQHLVDEISTRLRRWEIEFAEPAIEARRRGPVATATLAPNLAGKVQFDAIRAAMQQFLTAEDAEHVVRMRAVDAAQRTATIAVLLEIVVLAAIVVFFGQRVLAQTRLLERQQRDLAAHAEDLEAQAIQLEEQAVELEQQSDEARALTTQLEASNEGLHHALAEADRARETLATERQFLRQVIDTNPNCIFAKDRAGRFTLVNRAVADIYGATIDQLIGRTDADFNTNPEEVEAFRRDDLAVIDRLETRQIPEERVTDASGGVHWLQTVKRPIVGSDGRADQVLGVSTDITDRKRLEAQLLQAQKIEAVGRLAGGIAHDFNNLLTVITSYTGLVFEQLPEGDPLRGDVGEIRKAADRAARLTSQLLAFSRKQIAMPRILDINVVVVDLDKMLRRLISEDIDLRIVPGAERVFVRADPGQIEQVIVNLAVNARDAMPNGGQLLIEISTAQIGVEVGRRLFPPPAGEYAVITVSDTGAGMDAETMSHIFEPFFTTKPPDKGTGLGLSTVYGIVKQAGGDVRIQSRVGEGTRIKIFLPRIPAPDPTTAPLSVLQPACPKDGGTILLVEDDPALCSLAQRVLAGVGYLVLAAPNGTEALALAGTYDGVIDLVATDVVMPGLSGSALVERLIATRPDLKILFMSGYTDDDVVRRGIDGVSSRFLQKPFTPEVLLRHVREALAGGGAVASGVPPGNTPGGTITGRPTAATS
jgi:two-component system, cell cycle sensor histidine kinase and response regulator CckA